MVMSMRGTIERTLLVLLRPWFKRNGYGSIGARRVLKMFYNDLFFHKRTTWRQKRWAYKRGFLSERIERYGLTDANASDFMPDAHYYKLKAHLNSPLGNWYDNKLTTRHLLRAFDDCLEDFHLFLSNGRIMKLMDCPSELAPTAESIAQWVSDRGPLAAKAIKGSLGEGFIRLGHAEGRFTMNLTAMDRAEFVRRVGALNGYAIVGYLQCHEMLRRIHDRSANALRLMTAFDYDLGKAVLVGAHMRFGTDRSGYLEHVIHGGILAGVDILDGSMHRPLAFVDGHYVSIERHPDTGVLIEGRLPHWERTVSRTLAIADYMPMTPHMVFDIIITDDGFRVLEVNSHSDISNMQIYYPYLRNPSMRKLLLTALPELARTHD